MTEANQQACSSLELSSFIKEGLNFQNLHSPQK